MNGISESYFWDNAFDRIEVFEAIAERFPGDMECGGCPYSGKVCKSYTNGETCAEILKTQFERYKEKK